MTERFGTILIDPPWAFRTYATPRNTPHRTAVDHYNTLHSYEIAALPVPIWQRAIALFFSGSSTRIFLTR